MQRRRNYFIKKKFQTDFSSRFILLLLLESFLIGGLFMHISGDTITTGYLDSVLRVEKTSSFFFIPFLLITLIVVVGIAIAGMAVFTLLSHRIAGPLYRFEKVLKQIGGGDLTASINLRKTDQLIEFKEALNTFIDSLDKRMGSIKNGLIEVQELLTKTDDPEVISKLNKTINVIKDELSHFKVTSDFKE